MTVDYKFKIIIIGKKSVGKTSLVRRYVDDKFNESYIPTLKSDFSTKDIHYKGINIRLVLIELGGHAKYAVHQVRHFKLANYMCCVASFDDKDSLKILPTMLKRSMDAWHDQNKSQEEIPVTAILNKIDLIQSDQEKYAYKKIISNLTQGVVSNGILFTSAKTGEGVQVLFNKIALFLLTKMQCS